MQKIRTFIAIKIPVELQKAFEELIRHMQRIPGDVRWVNPHSVHITLKFLGEISAQEVENVFGGMEKAVAGVPAFSLKTGSKGAFPDLKRPRVYWVGLTEENNSHLLDLQKNIEKEMALCGFPAEERAFKAHLTVGRVKNPRGIEAVSDLFMKYQFPEIEFFANEVLVMKSELTPRGPVYSVQKAFPLK